MAKAKKAKKGTKASRKAAAKKAAATRKRHHAARVAAGKKAARTRKRNASAKKGGARKSSKAKSGSKRSKAKSRAKKGKSKRKQSAAQKANTARLVAMNKAKAKGRKGKGKSRKGKGKSKGAKSVRRIAAKERKLEKTVKRHAKHDSKALSGLKTNVVAIAQKIEEHTGTIKKLEHDNVNHFLFTKAVVNEARTHVGLNELKTLPGYKLPGSNLKSSGDRLGYKQILLPALRHKR